MTINPSARNTQATPADDHFPVVIWLLLGGSLLVRALGFAYPFLAFYVAARGQSSGVAGAVVAAFGVGLFLGQLIGGESVDRKGGRWTLTVAMSLAAVVLGLLACAHSVPALLAGSAVAGLVYDAPRPVLSAAIAELIPDPRRRAEVDTWRYGWVMNGGGAMAASAGGLLADRMGLAALYWLNALACAVFAAIAVCCVPPGVHRPASTGASSYRPILSDGRLILLLVSSVATCTAFMGLSTVMPMLMSARELGPAAYGLVMLVNTVAVIVITPLLSRWLSRCVAVRPRLDILAAAATWITVCMAAAGLAYTTLGFALSAALCAPGEIVWFAVAAGIVHRIAPPEQRGRYHGVWGSAIAVAAVIAPALAACSMKYGGQMLVAITTLVVGLLGTAFCLPLARATARTALVGGHAG